MGGASDRVRRSCSRTAKVCGETVVDRASTTSPGEKSFFSCLNVVASLPFSSCFFSAMALHKAQGYCPLNVICTAWVKGTISEYSRIMFAQATHCRTGH